MSYRLIVFAFTSSLLMFSPVHADEEQAGASASGVTPANTMEERIRAYRESYDRRRLQADERHEDAQARHESMRQQHETQVAAPDEELSERQKAMRKFHEEQRAIYIKRQEDRAAIAAQRLEARLKYQEARMETFLKEREEKLVDMEKQQEAMRNRAEDQHNYLVENQDKIMQGLLEQKVEIANRHEELRKQADERRKKMAAVRTAMAGMTPQEKWTYMQEHQEDVFGAAGGMQPGIPRAAARPPLPPWMQQAPRPLEPPVPQP